MHFNALNLTHVLTCGSAPCAWQVRVIGGKRDDAVVSLGSLVEHLRLVIDGASKPSAVTSAGAGASTESARKEEEGGCQSWLAVPLWPLSRCALRCSCGILLRHGAGAPLCVYMCELVLLRLSV
jgi:hypothetical protein